MQYYVDGFRPGDPDIKPAATNAPARGAARVLPEEVDVLIAGCGPAGLCLAAQLAQHPEFTTMIVEPKPGPIEKGQADGVNVRSMEMFQAFGFADTVKREAYWVNQTNFWMPDPANPAHIRRVGRQQDVADDQSEMPHTLMNQARIHELFLNVARNAPTRLEPDYGLAVQTLEVDTTTEDHPVKVTLERADGTAHTVRANYVVGADGARSNVRKAIGGQLHGDAAHQAWGVMDILANSDFPDIRMKNLITSATEGNVLILPREGGYLFRMYVELDKLNPDERVANRNLDVSDMIAAANRIMAPYSIDVKEVVWWSIYEIGHRLTDKFDDVPEGETATRNPRVFTAGDACHTHSPKAGQGMNVSMGDTFNLGWKLVSVLKGRSDPSLLHSYTAERRTEAKRLVETDHKWARIMSAPVGESELDGGDMPRFQKHFIQNLEFTGGLAVQYDSSALTSGDARQSLATGEPIGKRFHSAPVVRVADAMTMQLGHVAEADGRWRIYAFAGEGDDGTQGGEIAALCDWLETDPASPVVRYRRADEDIDAVIDLRAIFQQSFDRIEHNALPSLLRPETGALGLRDFEKAFCVDHKSGHDIYDMRGIDRAKGCMIVVRPDQYVAHILPLDAYGDLAAFFAGILLPQDNAGAPSELSAVSA
ncbi:FAD-dependent monooxygenase [Maritimibacter dapengensis]|uniref:FAD-dependent monooxygenase n=1 Tax=Maritimibacter dapengensis TaxID=2836868 RepID=A0ABS6T0W5_9RHOB|nr:FAD-dependent monooxygenase [Maritimibacter dapengensis]MBV7378864.1 FAD-dependent monooxygenase [Maritimibacter dapengensis]